MATSGVFVIAECGSCHDMSLEKAGRLIKAAADAGASAAKFQYWSSAVRMARRRHAPDYLAVYEKYQIPEAWLSVLQTCCHANDIVFMCSTYLPEDVEVVAEHVTRFKIASFEAGDIPHLVAHVPYYKSGKPIYISCGLGASRSLIANWLLRDAVTVATPPVEFLLCVSAYPAPLVDLHLRRLHEPTFFMSGGSSEPRYTGFSDHTAPTNLMTGALAVAAGARVVERHIRLDDTDQSNPDAPHAMTPAMFKGYVQAIRVAEEALGSADWASSGAIPSEAPMRAYRVRS